MKKLNFLFLLLVFSCASDQIEPDAYGNFEATEIAVSAQHAGRLLKFQIEEGQTMTEGKLLGYIDTTLLHLKKEELKAKIAMTQSQVTSLNAEIAVMKEQKVNILKEVERFKNLAEDGAAPTKTVDDLKDQAAVLTKRISALHAQKQPLLRQVEGTEIQLEQISQQIKDAVVVAPASGTVLLKLAEPGELVAMGSPLFRMANLSYLTLRAYLSGTQLDNIEIGQNVKVLIDKSEEEYHELSGTITWVAAEAEFTPTNIQTKEERTDLMYAIKIRVKNDGKLKIGMPAEVIFDANSND